MLQDADQEPLPERADKIPWRFSALFIGSSLCLLLSVAFWNRYPTFFSDSGSYMLTAATWTALRPFRAPGYSAFIRLTSVGWSPWLTVVVQAVTVLYVLYRACCFLIVEVKYRHYALFACVCVLALVTSLPWLVSELMPDVFAGVLFLSAILLASDGGLRVLDRVFLVLILMISVSSHMSYLPIAMLLIAALICFRFYGFQMRGSPPIRLVILLLLVPVFVSGLFTASVNKTMGLGFRLSPGKNMFLLARLFDEGLAADFLRTNCASRHFIACKYLANLPRTDEEFLFKHPLLADLSNHPEELEGMISGTLGAHPVRFAAYSAANTLRQLGTLRTGDEIRSYGARDWNNGAMQRVFPREYREFLNSRQMRGHLLSLADAAAIVDDFAFWLSLAACLLLTSRDRFDRIAYFLYWSLGFLIINAAVCATFSGIYDRYQSRVAWLIPFCFFACAFRLFQENQEVQCAQSCEQPASAS